VLTRILADMTVILHLLWILFLIAGAFWGRRVRNVMVIHVLGMGFSLVLQLAGWYCPLTHLEFWLRQRHDPGLAYPGSFIAHYAEKFVYLEVPPNLVLALTLLLVMVNGWVYRTTLRKRTRSGPTDRL
jgi:hypothetical protein